MIDIIQVKPHPDIEFENGSLKQLQEDAIIAEIEKIYAAAGWDPSKGPSGEYTGKTSPIVWNKVHNLPDHVYFNHSQHVTVGKLECQQCHGKIEEMGVVRQYAPLSMGWCINCHRQTEISDFNTNDYYLKSYKKYHDALAKGEKDKVTVEDIGGLECQKCHY